MKNLKLILLFLFLVGCARPEYYQGSGHKEYGITAAYPRPEICPDDTGLKFYEYNALVESMGLLSDCALN